VMNVLALHYYLLVLIVLTLMHCFLASPSPSAAVRLPSFYCEELAF
jgi:hypothetical protein